MKNYELRDKYFKTKWNEASVSCDVPYKQWVRIGFSWCWDICSEINKSLENDNESYSKMIKRLDDKLEQRENELADYKIKVSNLNKLLQNGVLIEVEDYLNIVGVIRNIVDDIETPYRLGLSESKINPEWKALNRAKELINKWNKEGPY